MNAKEEIIQRQRISGLHRTKWNLKNIAGSVENILCIKRQDKLAGKY